jgi:hypothetical protein
MAKNRNTKVEIGGLSYANASDALTDNGYEKTYTREGIRFIKNGRNYKYVGMDHYNTEIFSVTIREE